jgi:bacterioferritin-associated ferredoxin
MYICICNAITEKQLEEAQKTSKTFKDVCKTLGLGTDCGACIQDAYQTVQKNLKSTKQDPKKS